MDSEKLIESMKNLCEEAEKFLANPAPPPRGDFTSVFKDALVPGALALFEKPYSQLHIEDSGQYFAIEDGAERFLISYSKIAPATGEAKVDPWYEKRMAEVFNRIYSSGQIDRVLTSGIMDLAKTAQDKGYQGVVTVGEKKYNKFIQTGPGHTAAVYFLFFSKNKAEDVATAMGLPPDFFPAVGYVGNRDWAYEYLEEP